MAGSTFIHTDTSAAGAALAHTYTFTTDAQLREIRLHVDATVGTVANLTVTIGSSLGAIYDELVLTHDMNGITDVLQTYNPPILIHSGDAIVSAWANADGDNWGYQIVVEGR